MGHINWLLKRGHNVALFTSNDRKCLYPDSIQFLDIPEEYYHKYGKEQREMFGLYRIDFNQIKSLFINYLPKTYKFPDYFVINNKLKDRCIFKPLKPTNYYPPNILVFPRYRATKPYSSKNLPKEFYQSLIVKLCETFPDKYIISFGHSSGSYDINLEFKNYINDVRDNQNLQELINLCYSSISAIGSQSSLPKISLLQGVPTYIIGHEKNRHLDDDNWMKTRGRYWEIGINDYNSFNKDECIKDIIDFVFSENGD